MKKFVGLLSIMLLITSCTNSKEQQATSDIPDSLASTSESFDEVAVAAALQDLIDYGSAIEFRTATTYSEYATFNEVTVVEPQNNVFRVQVQVEDSETSSAMRSHGFHPIPEFFVADEDELWLTVDAYNDFEVWATSREPRDLEIDEAKQWLVFTDREYSLNGGMRISTFSAMTSDNRIDKAILDASQLEVVEQTSVENGLRLEVQVGPLGTKVVVDIDDMGRVVRYEGEGTDDELDEEDTEDGVSTLVEMDISYDPEPLKFERPSGEELATLDTMSLLLAESIDEECSNSIVEPGNLRSLDHCIKTPSEKFEEISDALDVDSGDNAADERDAKYNSMEECLEAVRNGTASDYECLELIAEGIN